MLKMLSASALALAMAAPAAAQDYQDNDYRDSRSNAYERQDDRHGQKDDHSSDDADHHGQKDSRYRQDQRYGQQDDRASRMQRYRDQRDRASRMQQQRMMRDDRRMDRMQRSGRRDGQQAMRGDGQSGKVMTQGELVATKTVERRDTDATHVVGQIRTRDGRMMLVDLGDREQYRRGDLQRNERVRVEGYPARVGNRLVLIGTDLQTSDDRMSIQRQAGDFKAERSKDAREISGRVEKMTEARVRGSSEPNVMARVKGENGMVYVIDLGQARDFDARDMQGQDVSARGREVRVDDRVLLLADSFRVGDRTYAAVRPIQM